MNRIQRPNGGRNAHARMPRCLVLFPRQIRTILCFITEERVSPSVSICLNPVVAVLLIDPLQIPLHIYAVLSWLLLVCVRRID